jgi:hypothetical protein
MAADTEWVRLAEYASGIEADMARATLAEAEVPVVVKGEQVGIFGAGFQGAQPGGITLFVPAGALDRARDLLGIEDEDHAT